MKFVAATFLEIQGQKAATIFATFFADAGEKFHLNFVFGLLRIKDLAIFIAEGIAAAQAYHSEKDCELLQ